MAITRVFRSGNSQAVRIPKQFRFRSPQVEITRRGNEIVLRERSSNLGACPRIGLNGHKTRVEI